MQEEFSVADFIAAIDGVRASGRGASAEGLKPSAQLLTKLAFAGFGGNPKLAAYLRELEAAVDAGANPDDAIGQLRKLAEDATPAPVSDPTVLEAIVPEIAEPEPAAPEVTLPEPKSGSGAIAQADPAQTSTPVANEQPERNPLEQTSLEEWLRGSKPMKW